MRLDLIDVFANGALSGNPLAVVRGGEALDERRMQALARWLGFSETTFLLPPSDPAADYAVRIFTPAAELPFAGHPTLGSAAAWLAAGGTPRAARIVQECGVGLVELRQDDGRLAFRAPPLRRGDALSAGELAEAAALAGVDPAAVVQAVHADNGPAWRLLRLADAAAVLAARPATHAPAGTDIGLVGAHPPGGDAQWEVRGFFTLPGGRFVEDPVTGSLNAGIAQHLFAAGLARGSYVAAQGRLTGADGRVHAEERDGAVWIGGACRIVARDAQLAGW